MPNDEVKLPVAVKPIGWMDNSANSLWSGELIFGVYYTLYDEADGWRVFREQFLSEHGPDEVAFIRELDAAKAAAQRDYETRIRAALEAALPPLGDGRAEIVEAAAAIADVAADEQDVLALSADESNFAGYRQGERVAKEIAAAIRSLSQGAGHEQ